MALPDQGTLAGCGFWSAAAPFVVLAGASVPPADGAALRFWAAGAQPTPLPAGAGAAGGGTLLISPRTVRWQNG